MMTRIHGKINFECDGCGDVLYSDTTDFDEALAMLRREEWESQKEQTMMGDEWRHYCDACCD
jgi:hypothetical protein